MKERLLFVRNLNRLQFSSGDQLAYERLKRKIAAGKGADDIVMRSARINCRQWLGPIFNYWNNANTGPKFFAKFAQIILRHERHVDRQSDEMIGGRPR